MADDKGKKTDSTKHSPHKVHDHHFRKELSNQLFAVQFMKHYLPKEISSAMDYSTLKGIKESFITMSLPNISATLCLAANSTTNLCKYRC